MIHLFPSRTALPLVVFAALGLGCNGNVVVDGSGGGGGAGGGTTSSSSTTTSTNTNTTSTSSGPAGCQTHADCPGGLCVFGSGLCADSCNFSEPCGQGEVCESCATSSCPDCDDCLGACAPGEPGQCDDHDDCGDQAVCLYGSQTCAPTCTDFGGCNDPNLVCNPCATGSCPGCEDCVGACTESF